MFFLLYALFKANVLPSLMHFSFGSPFALILLLLIPCFIWCRNQQCEPYWFTKIQWLSLRPRSLPKNLIQKIFIYILMVLALAYPFVYTEIDTQQRKGRDLILSLDASGSMGESGFDEKDRYRSKYSTLINLSKAFLLHRADDNIGAVVFGTFAYTASPLTYDLKALSSLLDMTAVDIAGESTAIGDAIMQSLHTLTYGDAKQKAIILVTDGYHNAGKTSPKEAVAAAKKAHAKIYTIGLGNPRSHDAALLQTIAKETGGAYFTALNAEDLEEIYTQLDKLEPSPIRSEQYLGEHLLFLYPLSAAFLLLLLWVLKENRHLFLRQGQT